MPMNPTLLIPEELFLITVHEKEGRMAMVRSRKFDILLAASILMELALQRKIDTDVEYLFPDRQGLTGHPMLDRALSLIQSEPRQETITFWLLKLAESAVVFRKLLIDGLAEQGLVRLAKEKVFLGFTSRTYPIAIGDLEITEVKTRIRELVRGDELPELRDMVIVSVAWYGGLFSFLFSEEEISERRNRIEQLARMDLIGQTIARALQRLNFSLVATIRAKEFLGMKSPEEKLEELIEEMKMVMHVTDDRELPGWLRKGTAQCAKTLEFIRETGTREITYNPVTGKYGLKMWAAFPGS
jgi:golgi phosphoprotein 3